VLLAVLSIGALIGVSAWVLQPFLGALVWAVTIVVATWQPMLKLQQLLWGRRWLAVTLLSTAWLLLLFIPLSLTAAAIVQNANQIVGWFASLRGFHIPPAPAWLAGLPLIGSAAAQAWDQLANATAGQLMREGAPYATKVASWLIAQIGSIGVIIVQFLLTVVLAAILYLNGESASRTVLAFGNRLAGERGINVVRLAGRAIRGVALGIVLTALAQSILGGIGLAIAGVPFAVLLGGVMFVLCIAQIGVVPVLLPAVIWLYWSGDAVWGTVLLVWSVLVATLDNVMRPLLIRKGVDLPLLLIFAGVIGGLFALGLIGIFVGPVVLAVTYTLLDAWINEAPLPESDTTPAPPPAGGG
jgi:predicted PurR-regulated permease PerM